MLNRREFLGVSAALLTAPKLFAQDSSGFVVHEWGVVTAAQGATWASVRTAGSTLDTREQEVASRPPEFVQTWTGAVGKATSENERCVDKPIVYFYSDKKLQASLRVGVPKGRPAAWWPPASEIAPMPHLSGGLRSAKRKEQKVEDIPPVNGSLVWKDFSIEPTGDTVGSRDVSKQHWWNRARQTDSAAVIASGERERFIFYDALSVVDVSLAADWSPAGLELANVGKSEIPFAIAVRVSNRKAQVVEISGLKSASRKTLKLGDGGPETLQRALRAAGLYEKEASGLVDIWRQEFFEAEGYRIIYMLPINEVEALLPMEISPRPKDLVRVLLIHLECLGPEKEKEVAGLVEKLADDDPQVRATAIERLQRLGTLAEGALRRAASATDPQMAQQARALLEAMGVKP